MLLRRLSGQSRLHFRGPRHALWLISVFSYSLLSRNPVRVIMASQGGYAVVDVDDEPGDARNDNRPNLEFQTFLPEATASTPSNARTPQAEVPYNAFDIAYYQGYFDVDTNMVLKRVGIAMIPRPDFIAEACDGQVDLYGPFWTISTLILAVYITSTLSSSITHYLASPTTYIGSDLPLLSTAVTLLYAYGLAVPALLWAATKWLGMEGWAMTESLAIYGYAMSVFVPISLLCLIPVGILRWVLVGLGAASSGYFLFLNISPILTRSDHPAGRLLLTGILGLHAAVALAMKVLFFSYSVNGVNIGPDPVAQGS